MHPVFAGDQLRRCDLSGAVTLPEYLAIIRDYVARNPGDGWVTGGGWSMEAFPGGIPTAAPLDEVAPDRPVFLPNRDGHGAWVNSKALQLAGITRDTLDPADGRIERDADGNPVGMLQEGAQNLVSRLLPELTEEDRDEALRLAQEYLLIARHHRLAGRDHRPLAQVGRPAPGLPARRGPGTLRATVVGALWWDRHRGLDQLAELIEQRDLAPDGRFRATSVKMMLDGVAENHTAAMLEPYLDGHGCQTEVTGLDFIDPAELPRFVTALDQAGFQVHFHALGDRAVRNALDAIEAARQANGAAATAPASATTSPTCRSCTRTTSHDSRNLGRPPTSRPCGRRTNRRWTSSRSRSSASVARPGSTRSARCTTRARRCVAAATGRSAAPTRCGPRTWRSTGSAGRRGRGRPTRSCLSSGWN